MKIKFAFDELAPGDLNRLHDMFYRLGKAHPEVADFYGGMAAALFEIKSSMRSISVMEVDHASLSNFKARKDAAHYIEHFELSLEYLKPMGRVFLGTVRREIEHLIARHGERPRYEAHRAIVWRLRREQQANG